MPFRPPEHLNVADYFLDERIREGRGHRIALRTAAGTIDYQSVQHRANRFANVLVGMDVGSGSRVMVALPDTSDFPAALFGILKTGGQVVMVNPHLGIEQIRGFYDYVEPHVVITHVEVEEAFRAAAPSPQAPFRFLIAGDGPTEDLLNRASPEFRTEATRATDPAIWLFSGGTTGQPKGVVQSHASFANTTECYGKGVLELSEDDITLSVPKLYFGYATGSNLLFPFSVGGSCVLFPERCTVDELFMRSHPN